jgi:flagellar hook-associated protein 2
MVTEIRLGNVFNSGGKNVIGGSQSQLDTESLINALTAARRVPADRLETKNELIDEKTSAYNTLRSLLSRFQSATDALRAPPGVDNASQNIFEYRTATLAATGSGLASNYLDMTVEPGAANQNFTISEIEQLAFETKQASGEFLLPDADASVVNAAGDTTSGLFSAGTFTLRNVTGGSPVSLTLNEGDSLQSVVNKFNAVKGQTGIQANILKVSNGTPNSTYKIAFSATDTGLTYGFDLKSTGTVLTDTSGVLSEVTVGTTQFAQNAIMTIDGQEIERESNAIDDVIDGITFTLKQVMDDGTRINAAITPDTQIVANAITAFADVYNEFRLFAARQLELGDNGLPSETAVLANETLMRTIISQVASEVTRVVNGITDGQPERLADIGINFSDFVGDEENPATRNIMVVDSEKLTSALNANFDGVRGLFEFTLTADNPALSVFERSNALNVSEFVISRSAGGIYRANYTDADGVARQVEFSHSALGNGVTLRGKEGTDFEGLVLLFSADVSGPFTPVNVNISQGFGDRLYNLMDSIIDEENGSLSRVLTDFEDQLQRNRLEITDIDSKIETYREQLVNQYAQLESALTKANQLLQLLDAQQGAREAG